MSDITKCPKCDSTSIKIVSSRKIGGTVIRRKKCKTCNEEIFTKELIISKCEYNQLEQQYQQKIRPARTKKPKVICDVLIQHQNLLASVYGDFAKLIQSYTFTWELKDNLLYLTHNPAGRRLFGSLPILHSCLPAQFKYEYGKYKLINSDNDRLKFVLKKIEEI